MGIMTDGRVNLLSRRGAAFVTAMQVSFYKVYSSYFVQLKNRPITLEYEDEWVR